MIDVSNNSVKNMIDVSSSVENMIDVSNVI